jgi:hypothetical protein
MKETRNNTKFNAELLEHEGAEGAVSGLVRAPLALRGVRVNHKKCHLFLPSPMYACPRHDPLAMPVGG